MVSAYKYRLYPNNFQKVYFEKCFGCVRFFFNKSLDEQNKIYTATKVHKNITPASYKSKYPFLKEVDSLALANAQLDRENAFKSFFKKQNKFPKFKSKKNEQSFTTNNQNSTIYFSNDGKYISIPKCKNIRIKKHRNFDGKIKKITIRKTTDNKYYVSILVDSLNNHTLEINDNYIGLDLGIKDLIITSNNTKYPNPKNLLKSQKKLGREQRKLSHMKKGGKNYSKQRIKIAKIHKLIENRRTDYLHKISLQIIKENQFIFIEDLKIKNMKKNHKLTRSISDASWAKFIKMLSYKAEWYGRNIIKVPTNFPSSQLCSYCGYQNKNTKNLSLRAWECPMCGRIHDRDVNASINILHKGIETLMGGAHPDSLLILELVKLLEQEAPTSRRFIA